MTASPPPPGSRPVPPPTAATPPKTALGRAMTQFAQQIQSRFGGTVLQLRPDARLPELEVRNPEQPQGTVRRKLLGDRYTLGRSSQNDIQVNNELVSGTHVSLRRDPEAEKFPWSRPVYVIKDKKSTNGVYWGKRKIEVLELRHGDRITLGPPELVKVVELRYVDPPSRLTLALKYGVYGFVGMVVLGAAALGLEWSRFSVDRLGQVEGPIAAYAGDNTPLETLRSPSHVELASLPDFSPAVAQAVLASEDTRFYWHFGFDPVGIARAVFLRVTNQAEQGASTLTQQVARSLFPDYVGTDDSLGRKLREIVVATKLETFYSKDELLLTYLNRVYLGVGYGFEDAAQQYFNKSARDLTVAEAALLVGILPSPNGSSPCVDLEQARGYRNRVIERMAEQNRITNTAAEEALRSPVTFDEAACNLGSTRLSPYFYSSIIDELLALFGEEVTVDGNFMIETSLDLRLQKLAERNLQATLRDAGSQYGFDQGAVVTLDAKTGSVLAMVGGFDYQESQFNRATQAMRQPGSTFKVFAYGAAIEAGISPTQLYSCEPLTWEGQGYSACERSSGSIDMYQALAQSENAVALRVAQDVGLEAVVDLAKNLGIRSPLAVTPGVVLGQSEVSVLELVGAYGAIANGGVYHPPHAINRVYDSNQCQDPKDRKTCRVAHDATQARGNGKPVLQPQTSAILTEMLQGAVTSGTAQAAAVADAAGKTGTTNDAIDMWFVGYLPSKGWVTGVWLGNDDNSPSSGGSWLAASLWGDYMRQALEPPAP